MEKPLFWHQGLFLQPQHFQLLDKYIQSISSAPLSYLQQLRVEGAKQELETTQKSFNEITWAVGYEDINSFRKLFRKDAKVKINEITSHSVL